MRGESGMTHHLCIPAIEEQGDEPVPVRPHLDEPLRGDQIEVGR